jgi:inhibitor of cysteine peptidase
MTDTISSHVGNTIVITLDSNPSTGYEWIAEFDSEYIRIIKRDYVASSILLGASGIERFEFKALMSGVTTLTMVYKKSWEKSFADEKIYSIQIT